MRLVVHRYSASLTHGLTWRICYDDSFAGVVEARLDGKPFAYLSFRADRVRVRYVEDGEFADSHLDASNFWAAATAVAVAAYERLREQRVPSARALVEASWSSVERIGEELRIGIVARALAGVA